MSEVPFEQLVGTDTLAGRLRYLRALRRVDLRTFAERAGLSSSVISTFLTRAAKNSSTSMTARNVAAIARAWEADPAWLLTGNGPAPTARESVKFLPALPGPPIVSAETGRPLPIILTSPVIQEALGRAFDATRHSVVDLRCVDDIFARFRAAVDIQLGDLDVIALRLLDAAASVRAADGVCSAQTLLIALAAPPRDASAQDASAQDAARGQGA